jgi:hypothetical protein
MVKMMRKETSHKRRATEVTTYLKVPLPRKVIKKMAVMTLRMKIINYLGNAMEF